MLKIALRVIIHDISNVVQNHNIIFWIAVIIYIVLDMIFFSS